MTQGKKEQRREEKEEEKNSLQRNMWICSIPTIQYNNMTNHKATDHRQPDESIKHKITQ